ncbi:MAG TPA: low temperature requirement protein A [Acidimicrobiia bacterium]
MTDPTEPAEPAEPTEPDAHRRRLRRPRINAESRFEDRVKPLELFFDLVFVLAFTQCTGLMANMPTWEGVARGMLVLAVLWWAWVGYAWLTSVIDPEEGAVRIVMFGAAAGLLVAGLCAPQAFGHDALAFAVAYGLVRVAHIILFLIAARDNPSLHRSVIGLAASTALGVGLLVGAAFTDGGVQYALWIAAIVVDFGGPAVLGADGWTLVPVHFAERHGLIIILALGESVVALGAGARVDLSGEVYLAAVLGVSVAAALWWIYFDVVALITAQRLERAPAGRPRNTLARDSYSYLHFPMVAGIVLAAFGLEESLPHLDDHLHLVPAFALFGGVAIYLLAHVVLRLRNAHSISRPRLGVAVVLFALWPLATEVTALTSLVAVNVVLWMMIAYETSHYGEGRYRLRHGLDFDPPG